MCQMYGINYVTMACGLNLPSEENLTDAEVYGYRFHPQKQRHVLEDRPEASGHEHEDTRKAVLTKHKTSRDGVNWWRCRIDLLVR